MPKVVTLPPAVNWRSIALATYVGISLSLIIAWRPFGVYDIDWRIWEALPVGIASGTLYDGGGGLPFVWSPIIAPVHSLVAIAGYWPQAILRVAFVLLLHDRLLIILVLASVHVLARHRWG